MNTGDNLAAIGVKEMQWRKGDQIVLHIDEDKNYAWVQFDESLVPSLLFIPSKEWVFQIPLDSKYYPSQLDSAFRTRRHYIYVRYTETWEVNNYQNLAFNTHDQLKNTGAYPHVSANVETRDESVFYAKNVIDGKYANRSHGGYPFDLWGINSQDNAKIKVEFGRKVHVNRIKLLFRADFPHDNYWKKVSVKFSNGEVKRLKTTNSTEFQSFCFNEQVTTSIELFDLIKADNHSEFPALQQLEVYGYN
ncbi:hypothetical protein H5S41_10785 [Limosilactobacillus sp. Lr3000]|uniref:Carbohydrate-binding protein n=1 Tax=Limosilactobacillus albertensis TaxID=2759752 RepID=A0A839H3D1_9LACO|nr:hypothetical protein [Limosilactobacillus albertensis]